MSDNDRVIGNPVQKAMDAVVEAWESALNKIRECKQEYQAQLEGLAGLGGMPTPAQAVGVLQSFYERVKGLRNTLNQPAPSEALFQVELAPANAAIQAAVLAAVTPAPRKRLRQLVLPQSQVVAPSVPVKNAGSSEQQAVTAEHEAESPSTSCGTQGAYEDVNNRKDKGKDKAIDTAATTVTTPTKSSGNSKSGSGSIGTRKDIKGKGKAKSISPSPEPFSAKTLQRITKTVKKTNRLPLVKPVSMLKFALGAAAVPSAPGPSRPEQRPVTPEPEPESDSESESVYLSVLQSHGGLSSPPDASSTPGPSSTSAAVAAAGVSGGSTLYDTEEQPIARTDKATSNVEVVDCDPTTAVVEESNSASASASGSGSNNATSNKVQETQGIADIADNEETGRNDIKDAKGKNKAGDTPTKTAITASGSGFIPSKKDLKGKGKAIARSPSPVASSMKRNNNKVTKTRKNNKENKPFNTKHSPPVTRSSEPALNSKFNNNNIQEEIIVNLDKGKGKTIDTLTHIPTLTTTEYVNNNKDKVNVTTTTATPFTAEARNNNNIPSTSNIASSSNSTSTSTSGPGTIPNKKDLKGKGKGKAIAAPPSRSHSPGPSSPKTKPTTNSTDKANITKVTKPRPTITRERQTIKRSLAKKGQHWAFKLESHFSRSADDVAINQDKFFILCCPAPNCPAPNFGGKHPFREGRALQHFAAAAAAAAADAAGGEDTGSNCLMEIDGEDGHADADGDVQMTEAEIFERFGAEIVQEQKRWPVDDRWALKNNRELCMKVAEEGEEREGMLREL